MKNKFFTDKFVLTHKFAGVGSMEDYCEKADAPICRCWQHGGLL